MHVIVAVSSHCISIERIAIVSHRGDVNQTLSLRRKGSIPGLKASVHLQQVASPLQLKRAIIKHFQEYGGVSTCKREGHKSPLTSDSLDGNIHS